MLIILLFEIALILGILLWIMKKFIKKVNAITLILLLFIGIVIFIIMNYALLALAFYLEKST